MPKPIRIVLIGDYDTDITAHQAIPDALEIAANENSCTIAGEWQYTAFVNGARH